MADDWKNGPMRQRVLQQIEELLRHSPEAWRNAQDLENNLFQKSTKKEEYQQQIVKILGILKEKAPSQSSHLANATNLIAMLQGNTQNPIQGPSSQMNQPMTSATSGNPMMHTNPNQPQMVPTQQQGCTQMTHGNTSGGQMTHAGVPTNQGNVGNLVPGSMISGGQRIQQNPGTMQQPGMVGGMPVQSDMVSWQGHPKRRATDMIMINMNQKHPGMNTVSPMGGQANKLGTIPMSISGPGDQVGQMTGQIRPGISMQPSVPSPGFSGSNSGQIPRLAVNPSNVAAALQQQQQQQQQQLPHSSITFISPSPNTASSPVGGRGMNQLGAPSPNGMLNTPGQPHSQLPSPAPGGSMEERAYMEKVKQLQHKYLDTLRDLVQKLGNNDNEKSRKIKNLLDVLENPQKRGSTMENLRKCEMLLEARYGGEVGHRQPAKDNPVATFFDSYHFAMKSPMGQHTVHRTLAPAMKTLMGPDLEPVLPKRRKVDPTPAQTTDGPVISDIIQGEVARLPPRFKINLDGQQTFASDDLTLICQLDDPNLPCVPPITLVVPPNYPNAPPKCKLTDVDYETTDFLKKVREIMINRQFHLPEHTTITMILDTWEMCVRQACSGKPFIPDSINPFINLNALR